MMLRKKMDTLIFALIASYNAHRQREPAVAAPEEFQPFDLQALRNSVDQAKQVIESEVCMPQTV
jgi:hypothetical protein